MLICTILPFSINDKKIRQKALAENIPRKPIYLKIIRPKQASTTPLKHVTMLKK